MSTYEISKSSLLSLKAEILKKQDEVSKAKLQNKAKSEQEPKKSTPLEIKNKGVKEREANDIVEDENLLQKSKDILQAKAKLYEQLSKGKKIDGSERFLVQFGRKLTNAKPPEDSDSEDYNRYPESEEERHFSDEYEPASNQDDEWVEYVDCLGRTRQCLRKDLEYVKKRDGELKTTIRNDDKEKRATRSDSDGEEPTEKELRSEECNFNETSELLSNDMKTELMRQKWEMEEEELRKKSDLHYQDILFNEARVHGVGYYGFSKDEDERARQQEALKKLRQETEQQQRKAEDMRKLRDKQLAMRARAARNRKRARMGLPPEEEEEEKPELTPTVEPEVVKPKKTVEEIELEKKREEQRQNHVRPWDIGKEGVKEHVELTQEEWVHRKRKERPDEFAPFYKAKDRKDDYLDTSRPPPRINNPSKRRLNPYLPTTEEKEYRDPKKYESRQTTIINECSGGEGSDDDQIMKDYLASQRKEDGKTLDYYGQSGSKKSKVREKSVEIEDSIYSNQSKRRLNPYLPTTEEKDYREPKKYELRQTTIINECSKGEGSDDDQIIKDYLASQRKEDERRGRGAEIAPPPTFDYYGPSGSKKSKVREKPVEIEDSISAGLKFLRQQAEKKKRSRDDDMFIM